MRSTVAELTSGALCIGVVWYLSHSPFSSLTPPSLMSPRTKSKKKSSVSNSNVAEGESHTPNSVKTPSEEEQFDRSYALLDVYRKKSVQLRQDLSVAAWRQILLDRFHNACQYLMSLRPWQGDVGEALNYQLNVFLLAGTANGKTETFILNLLMAATPTMKTLIISPLIDLKKEQVRLLILGLLN